MKILFLLVLLLIPINAFAQFPVTIQVGWDMNPTEELVIDYTVRMDNANPVTVLSTSCSAGTCNAQVIVQNEGAHELSVVARNLWGTSLPTILKFSAVTPGQSKNFRIYVPSK